jgi:hypothetical protein
MAGLVPAIYVFGCFRGVIAGLVPAISILLAKQCHLDRDDRDKPGHDAGNKSSLIYLHLSLI